MRRDTSEIQDRNDKKLNTLKEGDTMASPKGPGTPPPVKGDFEFGDDESTDHGTGAGDSHDHGHDHNEEGDNQPATPWYQDEARMGNWFWWMLGAAVLLALGLFTSLGWIVVIIALIILCIVVFGSLVGSKGEHGGEHGHDDHGHGGDSHGHEAHGHDKKGNGADLIIKEADDLGIVNPPPETRTKLGAFGLYTIREDSVLVFYNSWMQRFYPNGAGAREVLPAAIRTHVPPGKWVEVPILCILRGRIDMSVKLVPFHQTVKITGGRTVNVEGTLYVRARQEHEGTVDASTMRKLVASFDGSKAKLCTVALQGSLDKAATKFAPKNIDGQLQSVAHALQSKVNDELLRYGLEVINLHFDTVEDPAEQEAGEIERLKQSGALEPMALIHKAIEALAGRLGVPSGGNSGGGNKGGGRGPKGKGNKNKGGGAPKSDD